MSTAIAHNSHTGSETVRQPFVKLFAIHYGLTFCLFMRTLYDTSLGPTLSFPTYTTRQLDLMSKSLNELLRHWRSCFWVPGPREITDSHCILSCFMTIKLTFAPRAEILPTTEWPCNKHYDKYISLQPVGYYCWQLHMAECIVYEIWIFSTVRHAGLTCVRSHDNCFTW